MIFDDTSVTPYDGKTRAEEEDTGFNQSRLIFIRHEDVVSEVRTGAI